MYLSPLILFIHFVSFVHTRLHILVNLCPTAVYIVRDTLLLFLQSFSVYAHKYIQILDTDIYILYLFISEYGAFRANVEYFTFRFSIFHVFRWNRWKRCSRSSKASFPALERLIRCTNEIHGHDSVHSNEDLNPQFTDFDRWNEY